MIHMSSLPPWMQKYIPVAKPILLRSTGVTIAIVCFMMLFYILPQRAIRQTARQFEQFLTERSTLLVQSRIMTVELLRYGSEDEHRVRLLSHLQAIYKLQELQMEEISPRVSRWTYLSVAWNKKKYITDTLPSALNDTIERHRQFIITQHSWLYTLEHTPADEVKAFLTASSSISLLTEQTNLLLQYQFWSEKSARLY